MKITAAEYQKLAQQKSPPSPLFKDMTLAFLVGGAICTIGQVISNIYMYYGLPKKEAATATTITLIFIGALLTGLKIYDKIAKFAGAGTIVPVTGFANSIVAPALEFKSEGYVLGMAGKMFAIAGPVLVFGISTSIFYGIILILFGWA
ncbi:MAG: stage V sporulation protein AC [Clostridiales bacterium]|nr:stage V sporulation protein AC [Clostridiales bacterium]